MDRKIAPQPIRRQGWPIQRQCCLAEQSLVRDIHLPYRHYARLRPLPSNGNLSRTRIGRHVKRDLPRRGRHGHLASQDSLRDGDRNLETNVVAILFEIPMIFDADADQDVSRAAFAKIRLALTEDSEDFPSPVPSGIFRLVAEPSTELAGGGTAHGFQELDGKIVVNVAPFCRTRRPSISGENAGKMSSLSSPKSANPLVLR